MPRLHAGATLMKLAKGAANNDAVQLTFSVAPHLTFLYILNSTNFSLLQSIPRIESDLMMNSENE
jgi:hypothetical protein